MRIAVIGAGISGNLVARLLARGNDLHLYEAASYAGGHTNTVEFELDGQTYAADTGFMVFNRRTYPRFCRMLELLGIGVQPSDMSFSVRCDRSGWEYQGSSINGLFAQRHNLARFRFWAMLCDIARFNREATCIVRGGRSVDDATSVGDFLNQNRFGQPFVERYLLPMVAAIWSTRPDRVLEFPLVFLLGFFHNHGLLQLRDRPRWLTIPGGARRYVDALLQPISHRLRLSTTVARVTRTSGSVHVQTQDGTVESFEHVVFATHADQTLRLLGDADARERRILGAFDYQQNHAVLHTDSSVLPRRRRAWASWNYRVCADSVACVTYDLRRLQRLSTPVPVLLSLNDDGRIDQSKVLRTFQYSHPSFRAESLAAQRQHVAISGRHRVHFCGAYWGYGFHEDGVRSALNVANYFGRNLDELRDLRPCRVVSTKATSRISAMAP
ncbi:MAG: FAD-dependent oxidoreductase [Planctomycetales bacterium]|nr:FAD-dependent oxidoreductase [Planctomycetales bacterium]